MANQVSVDTAVLSMRMTNKVSVVYEVLPVRTANQVWLEKPAKGNCIRAQIAAVSTNHTKVCACVDRPLACVNGIS